MLPTGQRASGEWIDDTLRARAEEKGLLARTPLAGEFPRRRVEVIRAADPTAEVNRLYRLRGALGKVGFISPLSSRFCASCDRLRLGCDGLLRLCVAESGGLDLRGLLRGGASEEELAAAILRAAWQKPAGHDFDGQGSSGAAFMGRIGG